MDNFKQYINEQREFESFCEQTFEEGFVSSMFDKMERGEILLRKGWRNLKKVLNKNKKPKLKVAELADF